MKVVVGDDSGWVIVVVVRWKSVIVGGGDCYSGLWWKVVVDDGGDCGGGLWWKTDCCCWK